RNRHDDEEGEAMKLAAVLALALPALLADPAAAAPPPSPLEERLAALASGAGGVVGAAVVEVESGRTVSLAGDGRFPMASTYKVPIALAVLHRVDEGALLLSEKVDVLKADVIGGGMETLLKRFRPGLTLTVKELLDLMVTESDNVA